MICIFTVGENSCVAAVETGGKQMSTGHLHLSGFKPPYEKKKDIQLDVFFFYSKK